MKRTNDTLMIRPTRGSATRSWRRVCPVLGVVLMLSSLLAAPAVAGSPIAAAAAASQPAEVEGTEALPAPAPGAGTVIEAETADGPDDAAAATFTCRGLKATIVGTNGKNTLRGTSKRDVIVGRGGNDTIYGGGGADVICAGSGNDTVNGGKGNDFINLGSGNDTGRGAEGQDTILGGSGNDKIYGEGASDTLRGGKGNDTIEGGSGDDTIEGGDGDDQLFGNTGKDAIWGGAGKDTIEGGKGNDTLRGEGGADIVKGGHGTDRLYGGSGADYLVGGPGSDHATGGGGTDACDSETRVSCEPTSLTNDFGRVAIDRCSSYSSWQEGAINLNGRTYTDSLYCRGESTGSQGWVEYDLGRRYTTFKAVLGIRDTSESSTAVWRFRIYGDGTLLASHDVAYGQHKPISVPVTNVLRLRMEVTLISGAGSSSTAGWGSPMVAARNDIPLPTSAKVKPQSRLRLARDVGAVKVDRCTSYSTWSVGPASIDGTIYSDSLHCSMSSVGQLGSRDYILSRAYKTFTATVGQRDDSPTTSTVFRFRVFGDGSLIKSVDMPFGSADPLTLDVEGVLRMRLEVERISGSGDARAVFGEPIVTP